MIPSPTTTLLTGPYDWDAAVIPLAEYQDRIASLRATLPGHAILLHGNSQEHGALAWATGFIPKLGPAFCLVPPEGAPSLLFSGGPGMAQSAQLLTWVPGVRAAGSLKASLAKLLDGQEKVALGGASAMSGDAFDALPVAVSDADPAIDALRRRKSALEQGLLRAAAALLNPTLAALRAALASGQGMRGAALAAEAVAYRRGAQDVRLLASRRPFGPPLSLDDVADMVVDRPLVTLALRRAGYWAVAHVALGDNPAVPVAEAALVRAVAGIRPGATVKNAAGIGLSWQEAPADDELAEDDVLLVRSEATAEGAQAVASAIVRVTATGLQAIWAGEAA